MALGLQVSRPPVGTILFNHPVVRGRNPEMSFFYVPGMFFTLWRGDLAAEQRVTCLVANQQGPVVVLDTTELVMQLVSTTAKTARKSEKMKKIINKRERDGQRRFKL